METRKKDPPPIPELKTLLSEIKNVLNEINIKLSTTEENQKDGAMCTIQTLTIRKLV